MTSPVIRNVGSFTSKLAGSLNLEVHILSSHPASRLNRDDNGRPKSMIFGGVTRGRISSQCEKRSIRTLMNARDKNAKSGVRTKELGKHFLSEAKLKPTPVNIVAVSSFLASSLTDVEKEDPLSTNTLVFIGNDELERLSKIFVGGFSAIEPLAQLAVDGAVKGEAKAKKGGRKPKAEPKPVAEVPATAESESDGAEAKDKASKLVDTVTAAWDKILTDGGWNPGTQSPDVVLFGRMLATNSKHGDGFTLDGCLQVAHTISVCRDATDVDYFVAVDDLKSSDHKGSAMIGQTEFTSGVYYKYATIDVSRLTEGLGEEVSLKTLEDFMESILDAHPSGSQNSFASMTPPVFVMFQLRRGFPTNLVNAFLEPVKSSAGKSIADVAIERLDSHWSSVSAFNGDRTKPLAVSTWGETKAFQGLETAPVLSLWRAKDRTELIGRILDVAKSLGMK